jgi:hypothetical protein
MRAKLKNLTDVLYTYCRDSEQNYQRPGQNARHWKLYYRNMSFWVTEYYFGKEVNIEPARNRRREIIDPDLFKVVSQRGNTLFKAWREWFEWIEEDLPNEDVPEPDVPEPAEIVKNREPDIWKTDGVFVKDPEQIPEWVFEDEGTPKVLWEPPKAVPTNLNSLTWEELFEF